jgi:hypothetical protein
MQIERNKQQNIFPPRNRYQDPPLNQIPPTILEPTNVINHEPPPYFHYFGDLHEEKTCERYLEMIEATTQEDENYLYSFNNLFEGKKTTPLSQENIQQFKDKSIDIESETRIFDEIPYQEEIRKM